MTTITCKIPLELDVQLEAVASQRRVSKSEIVRESLAENLKHQRKKARPSAYDLLKDVCGMIKSGVFKIGMHLDDEIDAVAQLVARYQNIPMSLADACLVRMAELNPRCSVFTLDAHFRIYRKNGRQNIPSIMPPDI